MANKNLLTYGAKVSNVERDYYSPVTVVPPNLNIPLLETYFFMSKADPWPNPEEPPEPTQDQKSIKNIFKNIFVAKEVTSNDISPVIERHDWEPDTVYDAYSDDVDMFELDENGFLIKHFYVRNRYDQVFKCLWNNNGSESTLEPYFQPGSYGTNNIFQGDDGYKWKYIYTIDTGSKVKFMDSSWMPVPVGKKIPNPIHQSSTAGRGSIDVINMLDNGYYYDPANAVVTVVITGDGTDAAGIAQINSSGEIYDVIVTNPGKDYTFANVSFESAIGFGAIASAPCSPIGGHGFDPISELGCKRSMYVVEFNGSENGIVPTDIDFHQVGILVNPTTRELNPNPANGSIYKTTTDIVTAPGFGVYENDEWVYQGNTYDTSYFRGQVLSFDEASNTIRLINTSGDVAINSPIFGNTSKTTRTLLSSNPPNFVLMSGYMTYIENRSGITRSSDGIEQFKIVLGY